MRQIRKFFRVRIWSRLHFCTKTMRQQSARNNGPETGPPASPGQSGEEDDRCRTVGCFTGDVTTCRIPISLLVHACHIQVPLCAKFCTPTWYFQAPKRLHYLIHPRLMPEICQDSLVNDYITLGDGDFTYSFDLCRFLQAEASVRAAQKKHQHASVTVVCSGIDPLAELQSKYKDATFLKNMIGSVNGIAPSLWGNNYGGDEHVSKRLRINSNEEEEAATELKISVHHSVNAIIPWYPDDIKVRCALQPCPPLPQCTFKNVIFNHPHIGNEDAQLHSRFLSHFFHSVHNHWLAPDGILHLTLVNGQFDRWKCQEAAESHGFELVHRDSFKPPPSPGQYMQLMLKESKIHNDGKKDMVAFQSKVDFKCFYQPRRHQSGKGFASRAKGGSETLSFRRKLDHAKGEYDILMHLPWQNLDFEEDENMLPCPHCSKSFKEERARKNHIKCVHDGSRKGDSTTGLIFCKICGHNRSFPNHDALEAHKKAKHSGTHTDIKPEWSAAVSSNISIRTTSELDDDNIASKAASDSCEVCGFEIGSENQKLQHFCEFIPEFCTSEKPDKEMLPFSCFNCNKRFKKERAQKQHENFCCASQGS